MSVFSPPQACSGFLQYLKELPVWIILGLIVAFVVIYGGKYIAVHVFHLAKNFKLPDVEFTDEEEPKKKEARKEEKKEEPKSSQEKEEKKEEKKVIKI